MLWRAVTGVAIFVIGALLVFLIKITSGVLGYLQPVLVPLAVAGIVAYLLDPVVRWLQQKRFSRILGIATVFTGFLLFFGILFFFVGARLSGQIQDLWKPETKERIASISTADGLQRIKDNRFVGWLAKSAFQKNPEATLQHLEGGGTIVGINKEKWYWPEGERTLTLYAETESQSEDLEKLAIQQQQIRTLLTSDWKDHTSIGDSKNANSFIALENFPLTYAGSYLTRNIKSFVDWLFTSSGKVFGFLGVPLGLIMVPIYLYYFLKQSSSIQASWQDYVPLKASHFKTEVIETLQEINGYLISFFRGQVLVAFIDGILVGLALTFYDLPYGLLIGVVMALLGVIPFIGNIICLIPACIIAFVHGDKEPFGLSQGGYVLGVVVIFVVVQQINSLLTAPKIVGDSVGLHPMTVIFSMLFWSLILGGFLGALLAVPITAAVKVIFRRYLWDKKVEPSLSRSQTE